MACTISKGLAYNITLYTITSLVSNSRKSGMYTSVQCELNSAEDTGCPTSNETVSMGLNYDLGDKLENLRRVNHF